MQLRARKPPIRNPNFPLEALVGAARRKPSKQVRFAEMFHDVVLEMHKNPSVFKRGIRGQYGCYVKGATRRRVRELARKITRQHMREEKAK